MKKIISYILLGLILSFSIQAKTSVWVAEKDNHQIILAGIIHFAPNNSIAWPDEYLDILQKVDRVIFETEIITQDQEQAATFIDETFNALKLTDGRTLETVLTEENWLALNQQASEHIAEVIPYNAAIASTTLLFYNRYQRGFTINSDLELYQLAKQQNKQTDILETPHEQLQRLVEKGAQDPNLLIEILLYQLQESRQSLENRLIATYTADTNFFIYWPSPLSLEAQKLYRQQIDIANNLWAERINQFAQDRITTLFIIDIENLVAGKESLLKKLQNKGYKISSYQK